MPVFRWNLARQRDAHGDLNTIVYSWVGNLPDRKYLSDIYYTSTSTAATVDDFAYHVQLAWENPGYRQVHYTQMNRREQVHRIRRVVISSST